MAGWLVFLAVNLRSFSDERSSPEFPELAGNMKHHPVDYESWLMVEYQSLLIGSFDASACLVCRKVPVSNESCWLWDKAGVDHKAIYKVVLYSKSIIHYISIIKPLVRISSIYKVRRIKAIIKMVRVIIQGPVWILVITVEHSFEALLQLVCCLEGVPHDQPPDRAASSAWIPKPCQLSFCEENLRWKIYLPMVELLTTMNH